MFLTVFASTLLAGVLDDFGPNQTVSLQSQSYATWAPQHLPRAGGIVFGKGKARFVVGNDNAVTEIETDTLQFDLTEEGKLVIVHDQLPYLVSAHSFSVCPMARHVRRNTPIAFSLPPYDDPRYFARYGLAPSQRGYLAKDFLGDDRLARLVKEADLWPDNFSTGEVQMDPAVREAILKDVNNSSVQTPGGPPFADRYTYFSGDFHVEAVILLDMDTNLVRVFGSPVLYHPTNDRINGTVTIFNVEFLHSQDRILAEAGQEFGPGDFASLFDLSLIFAELRDSTPQLLNTLIDRHC